LLCWLTGANVKVSLSGDGGDELFGGYNHYQIGDRLWKMLARIPRGFRSPLALALKRAARVGLDLQLAGRANRVLNRVLNLSDVLPADTDHSLFQLLISPNRHPLSWLNDASEPAAKNGEHSTWECLPELLQRMMWMDFVHYLPDDVLIKVDRAAMSVSLETRIPLLDHQIVEFAFRLPTSFKRRGNCGKWLLRQMLYRYVPAALVDRPKKGFGVPLAEWLRGPLREWADDLLGETRLRQEGFFNARQIRQNWQEHLCKQRDWSQGLWHVLMFQAWLEEQKRALSQIGSVQQDVSRQ
jgi:asparagine synthase (glutamine-hydrolysing)